MASLLAADPWRVRAAAVFFFDVLIKDSRAPAFMTALRMAQMPDHASAEPLVDAMSLRFVMPSNSTPPAPENTPVSFAAPADCMSAMEIASVTIAL